MEYAIMNSKGEFLVNFEDQEFSRDGEERMTFHSQTEARKYCKIGQSVFIFAGKKK